MRSLSRWGWYQFISLMHLHGVLSLKDTDYWTSCLRGKCVRRIHITHRDEESLFHLGSFTLPGHSLHQMEEYSNHVCRHSEERGCFLIMKTSMTYFLLSSFLFVILFYLFFAGHSCSYIFCNCLQYVYYLLYNKTTWKMQIWKTRWSTISNIMFSSP